MNFRYLAEVLPYDMILNEMAPKCSSSALRWREKENDTRALMLQEAAK